MTRISSHPFTSVSHISSTQSPATRLPNEILTLIFQLAQPTIPERTLSGPNDYYSIWKSYYTLPLVCKDWKNCAESLTRSILVIQSHLQVERIIKALEIGYLGAGNPIKSLVLDIEVIGEVENTQSMLSLFECCPLVEEILTIGFGLRTIVGCRIDRFDSLRVKLIKLKRFIYTPIDEHAGLESTNLLLLSLATANRRIETFDLTISHTSGTFLPLSDRPDLDALCQRFHDFSMLSIFYGSPASGPLYQNVTSITLRGINIILTNLLSLLSYPPPEIQELHLLKITLKGGFDPTVYSRLLPILKTQLSSKLRKFTFCTIRGSSILPADILWDIINSYKSLTHLAIDDVDLFVIVPRELPGTLVEVTLRTRKIPRIQHDIEFYLITWTRFLRTHFLLSQDLTRFSLAVPFHYTLPDLILAFVEDFCETGIELAFPTFSSDYDDSNELEGSVDLRKEWWGDNV